MAGVEPYATRFKAEPDDLIGMFEPKEINIVVAGGETQGAWKMFGGSLRRPSRSTRGVDQPLSVLRGLSTWLTAATRRRSDGRRGRRLATHAARPSAHEVRGGGGPLCSFH